MRKNSHKKRSIYLDYRDGPGHREGMGLLSEQFTRDLDLPC